MLPLSNLPLLASSRVPQILKNYNEKSTGSLSAITFILLLVGSVIRIFTTLQEVGDDWFQLVNYIFGALASAILLIQVHYFIL